MGLRSQTVIGFLVLVAVSPGETVNAEFTKVINLPFEPIPTLIDSHTQLNLGDGAVIRNDFNAGLTSGTSVNIEMNIEGGRVGDRMNANAGSVINASGGYVGLWFRAGNGSLVNIGGEAKFQGFFEAEAGASVNMTGGSVNSGFAARSGSTVAISGGTIGGQLTAWPGSDLTIAGGVMGDTFQVKTGAKLTLVGNDFAINGLPVPIHAGEEELRLNLPEEAVLSGTLADGTPFAFSEFDGDRLNKDTIMLRTVTLPTYQRGAYNVQETYVDGGIREGQQLLVGNGSKLPDYFNAGRGSQITLMAGSRLGYYSEGVDADVTVDGGAIAPYFDAFNGSTIQLREGVIGHSSAIFNDSQLVMSGGRLDGSFWAGNGSRVSIVGGAIAPGFSAEGSEVTITGGAFEGKVAALEGSTFDIYGGSLPYEFEARGGSRVNLYGSDFALGGKSIDGLQPGQSLVINARNTWLTAKLADGADFLLPLSDYYGSLSGDRFAADATLRVTLVPECATIVIISIGIVIGLAHRRIT